MSWHYITFKVVRSLFCLNFTIRSLAVVLLCTLEQQEHKTEKYNNMNEMNHVPPALITLSVLFCLPSMGAFFVAWGASFCREHKEGLPRNSTMANSQKLQFHQSTFGIVHCDSKPSATVHQVSLDRLSETCTFNDGQPEPEAINRRKHFFLLVFWIWNKIEYVHV